jgi:hypothetical protein
VGVSVSHLPQQIVSQNVNFNTPAANYTSSAASTNTNRKPSTILHISSNSKAVESVGPSQSMIADSTDLFMGQASSTDEIEGLLNEDIYGKSNQGTLYETNPGSA